MAQSAPASAMFRKRGKVLATNECTSVPKANICFSMNLQQDADLDTDQLEKSIQAAYGRGAKVQIDEVEEEAPEARRGTSSSAAAVSAPRRQMAKCRVMFDSVEAARSAQQMSTCSRAVQSLVATSLGIEGSAVDFEGSASMDEVDAITLKLDSDSSEILCGACLLYNDRNECEKVVCYSDRSSINGSVRHSGDTQVDDKSVHTIAVVQSQIPREVTQLFFTICSCAPHDLSGFNHPSIMLYANNQPDANLLEYSINQAAKSTSSILAKMVRQPARSPGDCAVLAGMLRKKFKMPLLCIDLCLVMAAETRWDIQALGTQEWNMPEKICGSYTPCQRLIEAKLRSGEGGGSGSGSAAAASV